MKLSADILDRYYHKVRDEKYYYRKGSGYQIRKLKCDLCEHALHITEIPPKCEFGDSNLGRVARLRGAMRQHLRDKHALQIAVLEADRRSA